MADEIIFIDNLKETFQSIGTKLRSLRLAIGDLGKLKSYNKGTLVDAINEANFSDGLRNAMNSMPLSLSWRKDIRTQRVTKCNGTVISINTHLLSVKIPNVNFLDLVENANIVLFRYKGKNDYYDRDNGVRVFKNAGFKLEKQPELFARLNSCPISKDKDTYYIDFSQLGYYQNKLKKSRGSDKVEISATYFPKTSGLVSKVTQHYYADGGVKSSKILMGVGLQYSVGGKIITTPVLATFYMIGELFHDRETGYPAYGIISYKIK